MVRRPAQPKDFSMFQRQHLTRITLAAALLSAAVITLPAQAGLLGGGMGGSLAGAAGGMGSLGARSLELNGQGAGRADAEASRPGIGRPLRDTLARGQERAGSGVGDAQQRANGRAAGQTEGVAALGVERSNASMGRAEGSGASSAGAAGAVGGLLTATPRTAGAPPATPTKTESPSEQPAATNAARSSTRGNQSTGAALGAGRADAGADTNGQGQASRNGNRIETSGSASAQANAQR